METEVAMDTQSGPTRDLADVGSEDGGWGEVISSRHAVVVLSTDHRRLDVLA